MLAWESVQDVYEVEWKGKLAPHFTNCNLEPPSSIMDMGKKSLILLAPNYFQNISSPSISKHSNYRKIPLDVHIQHYF